MLSGLGHGWAVPGRATCWQGALGGWVQASPLFRAQGPPVQAGGANMTGGFIQPKSVGSASRRGTVTTQALINALT